MLLVSFTRYSLTLLLWRRRIFFLLFGVRFGYFSLELLGLEKLHNDGAILALVLVLCKATHRALVSVQLHQL